MTKLLLKLVFFGTTFFASGAPTLGGGSGDSGGTQPGGGAGLPGGGQGAPGAGAPGGGSGSQPGSQGGQGTPGGQPGGEGLPQLRQAYETLKAQHDPYSKLNLKPEQITQQTAIYGRFFSEVSNLGKELGFTEQDIVEAFTAKPLETLDFLRSKMAEFEQQNGGDPNADPRQLVEQLVEQRIGPIQQRENVRMTNEANSLFERTVYQETVNWAKTQGLEIANVPKEELQAIMDVASEAMKYDADALKALKMEGKTAGVQKAFQEAVKFLDAYYLARSGRDRARVTPPNRGGAPGQQGGNQPGKKPTLDEIINGEASAVAAMPSMR